MTRYRIIVKAFDIAFLSTSYSRLGMSYLGIFFLWLEKGVSGFFANFAKLASDLQHFKDASWIMLTASICSAIFVPMVCQAVYVKIERYNF